MAWRWGAFQSNSMEMMFGMGLYHLRDGGEAVATDWSVSPLIGLAECALV